MSTKRSAGPGVPAQETRRSTAARENDRSTVTPKKDRSSNLCAFTFADGRQCRTPRCSGHLHLCYFHAQKEAESLAVQQVGQDISRFLPTKLLTACDLGVAMSRLFCAVAQGQVKPKVAGTLAYLAQTMLQSIPIAQDEYIHSFDTNAWRREVRSSFNVPAPQPGPAPHPASQPAPKPPASASAPPTPLEAGPQPGSSASSSSISSPVPQPPVNCHSEGSEEPAAASPSSDSSLATHHSPLPQAPLPPTSAEFARQVMAGRNSSRPGRENGCPGSSSSPAPSSNSAPARTPSTQPAPSSPCTPPTPTNSQPAPTPLAPQLTSPQQFQPTQNSQHNSLPAPAPPIPPPVPPGFGAPANWDVLIPPKPRRRFSRHWQLLE